MGLLKELEELTDKKCEGNALFYNVLVKLAAGKEQDAAEMLYAFESVLTDYEIDSFEELDEALNLYREKRLAE